MTDQQRPQMTPEQALGMLDNVAGRVAMSREEHILAQQAVHVLRIAIAPVVAADGTPKPDKPTGKPKPPKTEA